MIKYNAVIEKFGERGEKTGWTYIIIPAYIAQQLKPDCKKSFRVKGKFDKVEVKQLALLPIGEGDYIIPLNSAMRKKLGKQKGDTVSINLKEDTSKLLLSPDLLECLQDDEKALKHFNKLSPSHQRYYSNWIESAKTAATKARRIAHTLDGLSKGFHYGEMMRELKARKNYV